MDEDGEGEQKNDRGTATPGKVTVTCQRHAFCRSGASRVAYLDHFQNHKLPQATEAPTFTSDRLLNNDTTPSFQQLLTEYDPKNHVRSILCRPFCLAAHDIVCRKPKNARSKRAQKAREPKVHEDAKKAIFVRGSQTSERTRVVLSELHQLKAPNSILFSKRNAVHPFTDSSPLQFWSTKNDASLFLHASHSKKRPNNVTFARMFDSQVLDMIELGIEGCKSMREFSGPKAGPGLAPLFHFQGSLWDTDEKYGLFRNMLLDFFRGEQLKAIDLVHGLQHVISVTVGSQDDASTHSSDLVTSTSNDVEGATNAVPHDPSSSTDQHATPLIHFRVYSVTLLRSGSKEPRIALAPHGPFIDFRLRRQQTAPDELQRLATRKMSVKSTSKHERKPRNKNLDIDEMGDKVGRIHVGQQNLAKLQSRKMKGLKRARDADAASGGEEQEEEDAASS